MNTTNRIEIEPAGSLLLNKLAQFKRHLRLLALLRGSAICLAIALTGLITAGGVSCAWRLSDPGLRWLVSAGIWLPVAWGFYRWGWQSYIAAINDLSLTRQLEMRHPDLLHKLSAAVEFAQRPATRGESRELQTRLIKEVAWASQELPTVRLWKTGQLKWAITSALASSLLALVMVSCWPVTTAVAVVRLLVPWSDVAWPKETQLILVTTDWAPVVYDADDPIRHTPGTAFEAYVVNRLGRLPDDARLQLTLPGGERKFEPIRPQTRSAPDGTMTSVGVLRVPCLEPRVEFRVVAGDDDSMPNYGLLAASVPKLKSLVATLEPPGYFDLPQPVSVATDPREVLAESLSSPFPRQALLGSQLIMQGEVAPAVKVAEMRVRDQVSAPVTVTNNGLAIETSLAITDEGRWRWVFQLQDQFGFSDPTPPQYEITGVADLVPSLSLETSIEGELITAAATVELNGVVSDDVALQRVWLEVKQVSPPKPKLGPRVIDLLQPTERLMKTNVLHTWSAADELKEGGTTLPLTLQLVLAGSDYFDLGPPHIGRSLAKQFTVVSAEMMKQHLAERTSRVIDELREVAGRQRDLAREVKELQTQLGVTRDVAREDLDSLKRIELEQRAISEQVSGELGSLLAKSNEISEAARNNQISDPEVQQSLEELSVQSQRFGQDVAPPLDQALTAARKSLAELADTAAGNQPVSPEQWGQQSEALAEASGRQLQAAKGLEQLLDEVGGWQANRQLNNELENLIKQQASVQKGGEQLAAETLSRKKSDLSPQQEANLQKLADRQAELAQRVEEFQRDIEAAAARHPEDIDTDDAAKRLARSRPDEMLSRAAEAIADNRFGEATGLQQAAAEALAEAKSALAGDATLDGDALVKALEAEEERLEKLQPKGAEDAAPAGNKNDQNESADGPPNANQDRAPSDLAQQLKQASQRLKRLKARKPAATLEETAQELEGAAAANGKVGDDLEMSDDEAELASKGISQAREELQAEIEQEREKLAEELTARTRELIAGLIPRQGALVDEIARLDLLKEQQGQLSRGQLKSLRDSREVAETLATELKGVASKVESLPILELALRRAAEIEGEAAGELAERLTGEPTQKALSNVKTRLEDFVQSLAEDEAAPSETTEPQETPPQKPDEPAGASPLGEQFPKLAQLKMVRSLQAALLQETEALTEAAGPDGAVQTKRQKLAAEQQELASLMQRLIDEVQSPAAAALPMAKDEEGGAE